ncbi:MAG: metalloregulator ArsR/SmtB family transcription factor [Myxococcota bacterium]
MNDRLFQLHAEVCKTLANPWRLKLIELLRGGERPLKELVNGMGIPLANVSQHLNIMKAKGVVEVRREGSRSFYRLANPKIVKAFDLMREVLRDRLAETGEMARALSRAPPKVRRR